MAASGSGSVHRHRLANMSLNSGVLTFQSSITIASAATLMITAG
jgi:hypothetical protein